MVEAVSSHPGFWPALIATAIVLAFLAVYWVKRRGSDLAAVTRANEKIRQDRERTYVQAKRRYQAAKAELGKQFVVIDIIHDLGSVPFGRDSAETSITMDDAFKAVRDIRKAGTNTPVLLVLHTLGGMALPSLMIAEALRRHTGDTFAYIYYVAASGGTLMALACEHLLMEAGARIGPVNTQYAGFSIKAWRELGVAKSPDAISDMAFLFKSEINRHFDAAMIETKRAAREKYTKLDSNNESAVDRLADGRVSHLRTLTREDARSEFKLDVLDAERARAPVRKSLETIREMVDNRLIMMGTNVSEGLRIVLDPAPAKADTAPAAPPDTTGLLQAVRINEEMKRRHFKG